MTPGHSRLVFDRYSPLGINCEVTAQLRRLAGSPASVFDWHYLRHDSLAQILRGDFADYLQLPNLVLPEHQRHVVDVASGVEIHHLFTQRIDGTIMPQAIPREYPRVRARADHLIRRWRETVTSTSSVLYVRHDANIELTGSTMVELRDIMRECYPAHRFALLWLRAPDAPGAAALTERPVTLADGVYTAALPAPGRPVDWRGDDAAWDRLFAHLGRLPCPVG
jgi:hypothetical protein